MLGCEGLICKGEEQSEKRGYFKGAGICQSARTQSTNKQTLLRVGNCEWLSHGWYINFCPDCGSSNQSYSKIKAKSMQLQNTFNWHLLTLLLASCDHLWVISKMFWVSGCWSHNFVQPGKCNYRGKLYEEGELLLLNRGCKEWWAIQL